MAEVSKALKVTLVGPGGGPAGIRPWVPGEGQIDQPAEKGVESWRSELESLFHDGVP